MRMFSKMTVALLATCAVMSSAEARTTHQRKALTTAQVERAKANLDRAGTASTVAAAETGAKPRRACTNISCLGWGTLLGVAY